MSDYLRPQRLRAGDRVGVIAPSFPTAKQFPKRFEASLRGLTESLGVDIEVASHVFTDTDYRSATPRKRAEEIERFVVDPEIRAIFVTIGGYNSAELLPLLDVKLLRANPTVLVGYSDVTALLLGLHAVAGWHTFHGPTLMTDFGESPAPDPFTVRHLKRAICGDKAHDDSFRALDDPTTWTNEFLDWGTDAWHRQRSPSGTGERAVWREGSGTGALFGGNIDTINFLVGTKFLNPPDELVLFVEASGQHAQLPQWQRAMVHLEQAGLLQKTRALLVGRSPDSHEVEGRTLRDVILEVASDYEFPVVADLPFGHTSPIWTLPIGQTATVLATGRESRIVLSGAAVR